jgi:hypothetical protein
LQANCIRGSPSRPAVCELLFMAIAEGEWGSAVAEMQGLEGSFSFAERLLQRIWHQGDFDRGRITTLDGRGVTILASGTWNRFGGPDFIGARLLIGDVRVCGDVEMHLRAADWKAHGHSGDPKYQNVVLHVVLYAGSARCTEGWGGREIPVVTLLPLLNRSLEEYADEEAIERLANHPLTNAHEKLRALTEPELHAELRACAERRWRQKLLFAQKRLARLGWESACHHAALEVLGYRNNRGPMLRVAGEWSIDRWRSASSREDIESIYAAVGERWHVSPVRPANHPKVRLRQYADWVCARPDWPARLAAFPTRVVNHPACASTSQFRRESELATLSAQLTDAICAGKVGGTRLSTLVCDGFWPLLAAAQPDREADLHALWWHWYPGDVPAKIPQILSALGFGGRHHPLCHGVIQGLLGWVWREEERMHQPTACL